MEVIRESNFHCPYCGEAISILVDESIAEQHYIEDCEVCCRPMVIIQRLAEDGHSIVEARHEDDAN